MWTQQVGGVVFLLYWKTLLIHNHHWSGHSVKVQLLVLVLFVSGGLEWISTGLYLSPGMKTTLTLPAAIINKGWKVLCSS